jgi:hypothetical protein
MCYPQEESREARGERRCGIVQAQAARRVVCKMNYGTRPCTGQLCICGPPDTRGICMDVKGKELPAEGFVSS